MPSKLSKALKTGLTGVDSNLVAQYTSAVLTILEKPGIGKLRRWGINSKWSMYYFSWQIHTGDTHSLLTLLNQITTKYVFFFLMQKLFQLLVGREKYRKKSGGKIPPCFTPLDDLRITNVFSFWNTVTWSITMQVPYQQNNKPCMQQQQVLSHF